MEIGCPGLGPRVTPTAQGTDLSIGFGYALSGTYLTEPCVGIRPRSRPRLDLGQLVPTRSGYAREDSEGAASGVSPTATRGPLSVLDGRLPRVVLTSGWIREPAFRKQGPMHSVSAVRRHSEHEGIAVPYHHDPVPSNRISGCATPLEQRTSQREGCDASSASWLWLRAEHPGDVPWILITRRYSLFI